MCLTHPFLWGLIRNILPQFFSSCSLKNLLSLLRVNVIFLKPDGFYSWEIYIFFVFFKGPEESRSLAGYKQLVFVFPIRCTVHLNEITGSVVRSQMDWYLIWFYWIGFLNYGTVFWFSSFLWLGFHRLSTWQESNDFKWQLGKANLNKIKCRDRSQSHKRSPTKGYMKR